MVFIPMIDIEVPATPYCLRWLPLFKFFLFVELVLVVGNIIIKDYLGAMSLTCVVFIGYSCLEGDQGINIKQCLLYMVCAVVCGCSNMIHSLAFFKVSKYPCCFKEGATTVVYVEQAIRCALPAVQVLSGYLALSFCEDCRRAMELRPLLPQQGDPLGMAGYGDPGGGRTGRETEGGPHDCPGFRPFSGTPHSLGKD